MSYLYIESLHNLLLVVNFQFNSNVHRVSHPVCKTKSKPQIFLGTIPFNQIHLHFKQAPQRDSLEVSAPQMG